MVLKSIQAEEEKLIILMMKQVYFYDSVLTLVFLL